MVKRVNKLVRFSPCPFSQVDCVGPSDRCSRTLLEAVDINIHMNVIS